MGLAVWWNWEPGLGIGIGVGIGIGIGVGVGVGAVLGAAAAPAPALAVEGTVVCIGVVQSRQYPGRLDLQPAAPMRAAALGFSPVALGPAPHPRLYPGLFLSTWPPDP